jgi:hypothetical protein
LIFLNQSLQNRSSFLFQILLGLPKFLCYFHLLCFNVLCLHCKFPIELRLTLNIVWLKLVNLVANKFCFYIIVKFWVNSCQDILCFQKEISLNHWDIIFCSLYN